MLEERLSFIVLYTACRSLLGVVFYLRGFTAVLCAVMELLVGRRRAKLLQ